MIRVYEYGLLAPTVNAALIDEQMMLAHRYRNKLVEIERQRRHAIRQILSSHPDTAEMTEQLRALRLQHAEARDAIRRQNARTRSRSATPVMRESAKEIGRRVRVLYATLKEVRKNLAKDAEIRTRIRAADEEARESIKTAREVCGVYWGTYLLQESDADRASKEKMPPEFRPWRGEGRVSVQIQHGIPIEEMWGGDTRIQIDKPSDAAWDEGAHRGSRRRARRTVLRMRIASTEKRGPIWGEWPMILHRPLPEGAMVKTATVQRRRLDATRWYWRLQLTLDVPDACARPAPASGVVALNMGFCLLPDGSIRSGYLVGDDGFEQDILLVKSDAYRKRELTTLQIAGLTKWIPTGFAKAEQIRSTRDLELDKMKAALVAWRAEVMPSLEAAIQAVAPPVAPELVTLCDRVREHFLGLQAADQNLPGDLAENPRWSRVLDVVRDPYAMHRLLGDGPWDTIETTEVIDRLTIMVMTKTLPRFEPLCAQHWFLESTRHLHAQRSAFRLHGLSQSWAQHRFDGDAPGFALLAAWCALDISLDAQEGALRRSALRDRKEGYRILAAGLARRYHTLLIDKNDLRAFQVIPPPEQEQGVPAAVKRYQRICAGSELRAVLVNAFGQGRVIVLPSPHMTKTCASCGVVNDNWERTPHDAREHTCESCGQLWDQDANFCRNLLRAHAQGLQIEATERKPSRSQRLRSGRGQSAEPDTSM